MTDIRPLTTEEQAMIEAGRHIDAIKMIRKNRSHDGAGRMFDLSTAKRLADEYRASLPADHPAHPQNHPSMRRWRDAERRANVAALQRADDADLLAECQRRGWTVDGLSN